MIYALILFCFYLKDILVGSDAYRRRLDHIHGRVHKSVLGSHAIKQSTQTTRAQVQRDTQTTY
jgi:hypothetical protein